MSELNTQLKFRSRSEGRTLRPFEDLDNIQEIFEQLCLKVNYQFGEEDVPLGGSIDLPSRYLPTIGISLFASEDCVIMLREACLKLDFQLDQLSIALIAHDPGRSPVRESELILLIGLDEFDGLITLFPRDSKRPRSMMNGFDGYSIDVHLVLNTQLQQVPLKPWLRGTILAASEVRFSTNDFSSSLQPRPLTDEIRKSKGLDKESWIYVEIVDDVIDTHALNEVILVWVDDNFLRSISLMKASDKIIAEYVFITPTMTTLVYEASKELAQKSADGDPFIFDGSNSALLKMLFIRCQKFAKDWSYEQFTNQLMSDPQGVLARCLSAGKMKATLQNAVIRMMGDLDVDEA